MKKLFAVLTLFLAFAVNANAQQDKKAPKASVEEAAKMDAQKLAAVVTLQGTQEADFTRLFMMKYNKLSSPDLTPQQKKEITMVMEAKIRATLDGNQMQKLDANPELLAALTGADPAPKK